MGEEKKESEKSKRIPERGFKVTLGRFVDIILVGLGIIIVIFSLLTFIAIASSFALSARRATEPGRSCVLFSSAINGTSDLSLGPSGPCVVVLLTPIIIWAVIFPFIGFLVLKIWQAWNMTFLVYIWGFINVLLFLYVLIISCVVTVGERYTCDQVATLTHPISGMQECSQGGAYTNATLGFDGFLRFDDLIDTTETGLWISTLFLLAIAVIYVLRCILWTFRCIRKSSPSKNAKKL
ncbi:hypothetical protein LOD99_13047 [Oopsacas minuta]|uniref:MARVEL domain-containing protein n=1 Tax=Oopsacas minuta TaxID=111878 RepID=A0AAV7JAQ1_9METZ|nr:hypothetical protein LOD99_13047 [Oopsacas minuta]